MDLCQDLLRGVYAYGFEKPSAIQQRAIIPCIKGHDVIAQAQSGEWVLRCCKLLGCLIFSNCLSGCFSFFDLIEKFTLHMFVLCKHKSDALTGTGKTATFAITILQKLNISLKECQALVLAPTRELAQQVTPPLLFFHTHFIHFFHK